MHEIYKNNFFIKEKLSNDFFLSIFSKLIIRNQFLNSFKFGCYNLHPAVLPYYPGLNPISGMIFNGEKFVGATLHKMTERIDSGNIIFTKKTKIGKDHNLVQCMRKIEVLSLSILKKFISGVINEKKFNEYSNEIKKRKGFPKTIPNKGKINFEWTFDDFRKIFNAGFSGPYKSEWGKIYFKYLGKKKFISHYETLNIKVKSNLKKISKNFFILKIKDKVLRVEANDN